MACRSHCHSELQHALAMPLSRCMRHPASKRRRDRLRVYRHGRQLQPALEGVNGRPPSIPPQLPKRVRQHLRSHHGHQRSWRWHRGWRLWRRITPGQRREQTLLRGGGIIVASSSTIEAEEHVHAAGSQEDQHSDLLSSVLRSSSPGSCYKFCCCTWHSSGMPLAGPLIRMAMGSPYLRSLDSWVCGQAARALLHAIQITGHVH